MALNNEDKKDVQKHMGKALANKVHKVTRDSKMSKVEGLKSAWKAGGPYKSAAEAISNPNYNKIHKAIKSNFGDLKRPSKPVSASLKKYMANDRKSAPEHVMGDLDSKGDMRKWGK